MEATGKNEKRLCRVCATWVVAAGHWVDEETEETGPQSSPDGRKVTSKCAGGATLVETFGRPRGGGPVRKIETVRRHPLLHANEEKLPWTDQAARIAKRRAMGLTVID